MTAGMHLPEVVSPEEWLAARRELLAKEKELTRMRDRVNADRRRLPMVRIDKPYAPWPCSSWDRSCWAVANCS
jgi:predicted dithiol-disulfide oxidoreductase (DUF899 family)